jgi:hypothetical protein
VRAEVAAEERERMQEEQKKIITAERYTAALL